ncbi:tRNA pseudouridine(65) synthase TruC [Shewanella yunxiaonensis]|uniref:tRNA pseudouridine synthase C n=1 Tax=Shewanella yunxiaonensis TaxID=2829809 RepID=A0ABX7YQB2_9GAMM|nr:tRNA pseudouridine(65) synthase TruC [Shewanella yunxiaonensis]QUN04892.1 tRNA pseudouridine(65) synthase TruC [Shewanella yunxiaonensis]
MSCSVENEETALSEAPQINILYEDEYLVAIHKPAGLLVHKTYLARRERYFAMQMTRDLVGCHVFPVHRLDRPTSGVLLFAKSSQIAHQICMQFEARQVSKYYLALVRGNVFDGGLLDYPLKEELDEVADKMANQEREAQSAITRFDPLLNAEIPVPSGRYQTSRFALLRLQPLTGRKHQLRRHMDHLRHPIIGDTAHGDGKQNRLFREYTGINRLWLLAQKLSVTHPVSGEPLTIVTEPEPEWEQVFTALGWGASELSTSDAVLVTGA